MTRFIILSLLVVCLICVLQAYAAPSPQNDATEAANDASKKIQESWDSLKKTVGEGYDKIKPSLDKLSESTKDIIAKATDSISKEAEKIIPKTE